MLTIDRRAGFRRLFICILTAAVSMASMGSGSIAQAQADVLFGVYPEGGLEGQFFEASVEPGSSYKLSLAIFNAGAEPLALEIYPANIYTLTNGGMGVAFQDEPRSDPATWIQISEGTHTLDPNEERLFEFTVTVPDGAAPGQHVAAIGVETADSFEVGEGSPFRQVIRKVIAVAITVPGPISPSFELGTPELTSVEGQTMMTIPVANNGNIRVRPTGTVTIQDPSGAVVATGEVAMGSVYAGQVAAYELWMPISLPIGDYLVSADVTDPDTGASATLDQVLTTLVPELVATPEPVSSPVVPTPVPGPISLDSVSIEPNGPSMQFAQVEVIIANTGDHIERSVVTLVVNHNGELVESYELDDFLPLPVGETTVEHRYIPPTGWTSGEWTFGIEIRAISANNAGTTLLFSDENVATIQVP